ncbi:hypothetical protein ABTK17_20610, partial [Acinetobacter baumannii]
AFCAHIIHWIGVDYEPNFETVCYSLLCVGLRCGVRPRNPARPAGPERLGGKQTRTERVS